MIKVQRDENDNHHYLSPFIQVLSSENMHHYVSVFLKGVNMLIEKSGSGTRFKWFNFVSILGIQTIFAYIVATDTPNSVRLKGK